MDMVVLWTWWYCGHDNTVDMVVLTKCGGFQWHGPVDSILPMLRPSVVDSSSKHQNASHSILQVVRMNLQIIND